MNHNILTLDSTITSAEFGNKAYWLSWLFQKNYNVPFAIFIPSVDVTVDSVFQYSNDDLSFQELREIIKPFLVNNKYDVAIRSSASCEDTEYQSFAGYFKTIIGEMSFDEVVASIQEVLNSSKYIKNNLNIKMGVIIQKRIKAQYSGVSFSSNPFTGSKLESVIAVVSGMGGGLVSGRVKGEDILITKQNNDFSISSYQTNLDSKYVEQLCQVSKDIEQELLYPVDIEWCIEENTGTLYILQCRPITDIFYKENSIIHISLANQEVIPISVSSNHKVQLRLIAEKANTIASKADLVVINDLRNTLNLPDLSIINPTENCKAYSVVLIQPKRLSDKVIRRFVGSNSSESSFLELSPKYSVISSPEYDNLENCIVEITQDCFKENWVSILIIQEIFDPKYSGIIKAIPEGYVIELARGHFIPKGAVSTSQYVVSVEGEILHKTEVYQGKLFKIVNGYVLSENLGTTDKSLISLSAQELREVIKSFNPLLTKQGTTIEFGILETENSNALIPYIIDIVEEEKQEVIDLNSITEGIISKGIVTGKLIILNEELSPDDTLNRHFHDVISHQVGTKETHIFFCQRPDISLLKFVESYDHQKLGFIFKEGSVLCHLALVLREKGIPAIVSNYPLEVDNIEYVTIDAITTGISKNERIKPYAKKMCVFT